MGSVCCGYSSSSAGTANKDTDYVLSPEQLEEKRKLQVNNSSSVHTCPVYFHTYHHFSSEFHMIFHREKLQRNDRKTSNKVAEVRN